MDNEPKKVYIECHGVTEAYQHLIENKFRYYPSDAGISFRYFPYHRIGPINNGTHPLRQRSPLIALQFSEDFPKNQNIAMECYSYFKNVVHDRKTREGLVRFNVKINT